MINIYDIHTGVAKGNLAVTSDTSAPRKAMGSTPKVSLRLQFSEKSIGRHI